MAPKPPNRREREKFPRSKVRRGCAHNAISVWKVSWTDREGKRHRTYHATLQEAVAAASSKSGSVSEHWGVPSVRTVVGKQNTLHRTPRITR